MFTQKEKQVAARIYQNLYPNSNFFKLSPQVAEKYHNLAKDVLNPTIN